MKSIISVRCTNKECDFIFQYTIGFGMGCHSFEKAKWQIIKDGTFKVSDEITNLLEKGYMLEARAQYLCSTCKEWQTHEEPYILEPTIVSPYGTIREYKVHYLFDYPHCTKCGNDLTFILNPRSSKNPCPKCGKLTLTAN